jgi:UPF0755 protein
MKNIKGARQYLLIALIISLGFSVYRATRPLHDFPNNNPGPEIVFVVHDGEYGRAIGEDLQSKGVIKEWSTFVKIANDPHSGAQGISPGNHIIQTHISSLEALNQLLDRKRFTNMINVVEGSTYSDVLKSLKSDPDIVYDGKNPQAVLSNPRKSVEGQLAPASYTFAPKTTSSAALGAMLEKFRSTIAKTNLAKGYAHFSAYQVLTVASMVQIEGDPTDYAKVAGVIYNRLAIGMPLQLNSTVQYAANMRGRINLSSAATQIDSPYNTYRNQGLPPTPISNPSAGAIQAALNPAAHNYLYFITVKPHDTRFTKDYSQFNEWVTEFNKNRSAGLFK